ncbi:hypothetical protein OS493_020969 [Desmophyllum pertusum]|uniref:Uncharacterized protein n=1 Tax=Desmophyllum pertusum TaxID=174260 RepID=A0A9X0A175_9CNID|nr:hypothetical protein OS493_020969 [Desmophyllum pertusum]
MLRSNTRSLPDEPKINNICQIVKAFKQARCAYKYHVFSSVFSFESAVATASLCNRHSPALCLESSHLQWMSGHASLRPFLEHFRNSPSSSAGPSCSTLSSPFAACFASAVSLLAGSIFFSVLHEELNLSRLRKTVASAV